jgi:DNA-binding winged helix-turn-helix (wHTH) protein
MTTSFGPFTLDVDARLLRREGHAVHVSPKSLELLAALVEARPRVLSKAELQDRLWPDVFVAEANLSNLVAEIREALGDRARTPQFIRTAHGFGYAFCAEATSAPASALTHARSAACCVAWGQREFLLRAGAHVIGRDAGADVRLDASTVSRRHARLLVSAGNVRLEDLGSKNGTFKAHHRVTAPIQLSDGDVVRIGSLALTIRMPRPFATTDTAI